MKSSKLISLLASRLVVFGLLIAVQVCWIILLLTKLVNYADWISTLFRILSFFMIIYIIKKDEVPAYRVGWILLIVGLPLFGGLLYLLLGDKRPAAAMRMQLSAGRRRHKTLLRVNGSELDRLSEEDPRARGTAEYISRYAGYPLWEKTSVKYHALGEYQFEDMLAELEKAEKFIFIEYFILEKGLMWNSILEILRRKAAMGVDVRLIYDDMGCLRKIPSGYHRHLEGMGIKCFAFNPFIPIVSTVMNNRDHRKIMVIDGNTAFTGGINLADEYINARVRFGHWKDNGVMLKGEGVWSFTVMFLEMWNSFRRTDMEYDKFRPTAPPPETDGFVQPFCDSPLDGETVSVNVYLDILSQARDYVYIFTPYLAISDELQLALCSAAKRGVDVRIVLPGIPDKKLAYRLTRSYYGPLLKSGIRLYEYTPGFIHSKSYVCDDKLAVAGTINMDFRSLYLHFECGVFMYGCSAVEELKRDALETFCISHEVKLGDGDKGPVRNFMGALLDSVLRIFAPLF